jgi:preprotein translocase subunit SecD
MPTTLSRYFTIFISAISLSVSLLATDKQTSQTPHVTVELRAIGDCSDPATSEPMPSETKGDTDLVCLKQSVIVDENDIADARATKDGLADPELTLKFNDKGAARLRKTTLALIGARVALMVNGKIFAVAVIKEALSEDLALTGGGLTEDELQRLVDQIKAQIIPKKTSPSDSKQVAT